MPRYEIEDTGATAKIYRVKKTNPVGKLILWGIGGLMLLGIIAGDKKPSNTPTAISSQYSNR